MGIFNITCPVVIKPEDNTPFISDGNLNFKGRTLGHTSGLLMHRSLRWMDSRRLLHTHRLSRVNMAHIKACSVLYKTSSSTLHHSTLTHGPDLLYCLMVVLRVLQIRHLLSAPSRLLRGNSIGKFLLSAHAIFSR